MSLDPDFEDISTLNASSQKIVSNTTWQEDPAGILVRWTDGLESIYDEATTLVRLSASEAVRRAERFRAHLAADRGRSSFEGVDMADGYLVISTEIMAAMYDLPGGMNHPASKAVGDAFGPLEPTTHQAHQASIAKRSEAITTLLKAHNEGWDPTVPSKASGDSIGGGTAPASASGATSKTTTKPKNKWAEAFAEM